MERNDTDLSLGNGMDFIVLQPIETQEMANATDLESPDQRGWEAEKQMILGGLRHPHRFVHVGNFSITTAKEIPPCHPENREYHPCGGIIELKRSDTRPEPKITCSLCPIEAHFYHVGIEELPNLLLHLLMKQMFPELPTCNYFYCGPDKPGAELGMMAVAKDAMGFRRPRSKELWSASLGFVLMPGMQTFESFDGFDKWARFLVGLKFEQIKSAYASLLPTLIGKRSEGRQERRYFW